MLGRPRTFPVRLLQVLLPTTASSKTGGSERSVEKRDDFRISVQAYTLPPIYMPARPLPLATIYLPFFYFCPKGLEVSARGRHRMWSLHSLPRRSSVPFG